MVAIGNIVAIAIIVSIATNGTIFEIDIIFISFDNGHYYKVETNFAMQFPIKI